MDENFSKNPITDMSIGILQAQVAELLSKLNRDSFERYQEMNKIKEELAKIHDGVKAQEEKFKEQKHQS